MERLSAEVAALKARVSALEEGSATPALSNTSTSRSVPIPHFVANRERVNVREGPGIAFTVIGTVSQGERFDIQESNAAANWYLFCCVNGRSGWIYAPLLVVTHAETIPVAPNIPTVPPTNTPTPPPPTNTPTPPTNTPTNTPTRGLGVRIASENRCSPYDPDDYSYPQSVEPQIVNQMGGRIYSPYTGEYFASTRETDIEHIVARSEAHDSGLCAASAEEKQAFARDLLNLTLASPNLNRYQKVAKDVAEWLPARNKCWYVNQVVEVKEKYDLAMDSAEWQKAREVLSSCTSTDMQFTDPPPTSAPRETFLDGMCTELKRRRLVPSGGWPRGHVNYTSSRDRDGDGYACE